MPLDFEQLGPVDSSRAVFADRLERADDGEIFAVQLPGLDRAAVDEDRGNIQPRDGDHRAGHVLVAAADGQRARPPRAALHTVSMESAITSRDTSEYFMPSVPMEMPSLTVMVPKICGMVSASRSDSMARSARSFSPALQGVMVL